MGRLNLIERRVARYSREPPSVRNAAAVIVFATVVVVLGSAALMTVIDGEEYPDLGVALWWALQTVTTVGYGDVAPQQFGGRLVGALVMLEGTAFIAIVTAVITSTFITRSTRRNEAMRARGALSDIERIERRLDSLERKLDMLIAAHGTREPEDGPGRASGRREPAR